VQTGFLDCFPFTRLLGRTWRNNICKRFYQAAILSSRRGGGGVAVMTQLALISFCTNRRFLVLISVRGWVDRRVIVRLEGLRKLKNPMTSGIEPETFRLVIYCNMTSQSLSGPMLDSASLSNGPLPRFRYTRYSFNRWKPISMKTRYGMVTTVLRRISVSDTAQTWTTVMEPL
jgi:hypothetical protein